MLGWIVRGLLIVAGFVASWAVAKDAPQFGLVQMPHLPDDALTCGARTAIQLT
jgi:hypothetical protein